VKKKSNASVHSDRTLGNAFGNACARNAEKKDVEGEETRYLGVYRSERESFEIGSLWRTKLENK